MIWRMTLEEGSGSRSIWYCVVTGSEVEIRGEEGQRTYDESCITRHLRFEDRCDKTPINKSLLVVVLHASFSTSAQATLQRRKELTEKCP